jgi:hypothetical protein
MAAAQTPQWKTYSYPADGFSAAYPSEPELQRKSIPTAAGAFELHSYITQDSAVALFVSVCDYGKAAEGKDPDSQLQTAKNGALQNSASHLVSEKKIALGSYHGLEFEAESDQAHFSGRIYVMGTMLYQELIAVPLGKPFADSARFMDSFRLIPRSGK